MGKPRQRGFLSYLSQTMWCWTPQYTDPSSLAPKRRPIVIVPPSEDLGGPTVPYKPHTPALVSHCPMTLHFQPGQWQSGVGIGVRVRVRVRVRVLLHVSSFEILTI